MSFNYTNPLSSTIVQGPSSVLPDNSQGTNFSVYSIGGYMEVYSHQDLIYDPIWSGGSVSNSANTIPIEFAYNYEPYGVPDVLTLNSDEISTGRRRLGMMVYVISADTTYQYVIDDYATLWDAAETSGSLGPTGLGWECYGSTVAGQNFINAWTGSTIEGISGATHATARWKIANMNDTFITGGTYYSATTSLQLYENNGSTITITGFTGTVTGGTYNSGSSTLTLNNSDGSSVQITGITSGGGALTVGDGITTVSFCYRNDF